MYLPLGESATSALYGLTCKGNGGAKANLRRGALGVLGLDGQEAGLPYPARQSSWQPLGLLR